MLKSAYEATLPKPLTLLTVRLYSVFKKLDRFDMRSFMILLPLIVWSISSKLLVNPKQALNLAFLVRRARLKVQYPKIIASSINILDLINGLLSEISSASDILHLFKGIGFLT